MKRLICVLLMLVCSASLAAWDLTATADGERISYWHDKTSVRKSGEIARMWTMTSFSLSRTANSGYKYKSSKSLYAFDCSLEKMALLSLIRHSGSMGEGEVMVSWTYKSNEIEWDPIVPSTATELEWKIACGKQ